MHVKYQNSREIKEVLSDRSLNVYVHIKIKLREGRFTIKLAGKADIKIRDLLNRIHKCTTEFHKIRYGIS